MSDYFSLNPSTTKGVKNIEKGKNLVKHKANYSKDKKIAVIDDFTISKGRDTSSGGVVSSLLMSSQLKSRANEKSKVYPIEGFNTESSETSGYTDSLVRSLENIDKNSSEYAGVNIPRETSMTYEMVNKIYGNKDGDYITPFNLKEKIQDVGNIAQQLEQTKNASADEKKSYLDMAKIEYNSSNIEDKFKKFVNDTQYDIENIAKANKIMENLEDKGVEVSIASGNDYNSFNLLGLGVKGADIVTDNKPNEYSPARNNAVTQKEKGSFRASKPMFHDCDVNEDGINDTKKIPNGVRYIGGTGLASSVFLGKLLMKKAQQ